MNYLIAILLLSLTNGYMGWTMSDRFKRSPTSGFIHILFIIFIVISANLMSSVERHNQELTKKINLLNVETK